MPIISGTSFLSKPLYLVAAGSGAYTATFLPTDSTDLVGLAGDASKTDTLDVTTGDTTVQTHSFEFAFPVTLVPFAYFRLKWEVTATTAAAGAKARLKVIMKKDSSTLVTVTGSERDITGVGEFAERYVLVASETDFAAGDALRLELTLEVSTTAASGTADVKMHINPNSAGDEALVQFLL